jgi:hypothetical protein
MQNIAIWGHIFEIAWTQAKTLGQIVQKDYLLILYLQNSLFAKIFIALGFHMSLLLSVAIENQMNHSHIITVLKSNQWCSLIPWMIKNIFWSLGEMAFIRVCFNWRPFFSRIVFHQPHSHNLLPEKKYSHMHLDT